MGRLFTVNFRFKEQPVTALVNLRHQGYDLSCMVRYLDKDIATLVPEGQLVFSLANGMEGPPAAGKLGEELLFRTTEAISNYLGKH
jgi:hypothetical protein